MENQKYERFSLKTKEILSKTDKYIEENSKLISKLIVDINNFVIDYHMNRFAEYNNKEYLN
jgi:hypothetical protein